MDELIASLRKFDALRDVATDGRADTVLTRVLPSRPPEFAPDGYLDRFPRAVRRALASQGIEALYAPAGG